MVPDRWGIHFRQILNAPAAVPLQDPNLSKFAGRGSDPGGEGRWTIKAAIDEAVPAPVLTTALYERFSSWGRQTLPTGCYRRCVISLAGYLEKSDDKSCRVQNDSGISLFGPISGAPATCPIHYLRANVTCPRW